MLAVGWVNKNYIEGISSPVKAALEKTKIKANLLAAVNKWFAVGLKETFEKAWESLKKASDTIDTRMRT
jgi:hypothetical protein